LKLQLKLNVVGSATTAVHSCVVYNSGPMGITCWWYNVAWCILLGKLGRWSVCLFQHKPDKCL